MSGYGGGNRGGRGGGRGRGRGRGGGGGGGYQGNTGPQCRLNPCRAFTKTGSCTYNENCYNAHVVCSHAQIELPEQKKNNDQYQQGRGYQGNYHQDNKTTVSSVSIWETQGAIKIFTGSHDGYWRLYNTNGFTMEFENLMGGAAYSKVECVEIASDFLFCGFESISPKLPKVPIGMIHAWNLKTPTEPPMEFHISTLCPYAHGKSVSSLVAAQGAVLSGSLDSTIRLWQFNATLDGGKGGFALTKTLDGHVREVTGLTIVSNSILWSTSTDQTLRLWDLGSGDCKHMITSETQNAQGNKVGHDNAITCVLTFESELGNFVLSGSLDGNIKAWHGENGECLASESHGVGVVCMALNKDPKGNPIVLCGLENGSIVLRNVLQTQTSPAFSPILTLSHNVLYMGHQRGPVKCIESGPSNTFYSGGCDGQLIVWQVTGDLGL